VPHHFTKNTVSATYWCTVCYAATEHHVLGGRRAGCKVCEARQAAEKAERDAIPQPAEQMGLFGKR
jgi:hypothetical protein